MKNGTQSCPICSHTEYKLSFHAVDHYVTGETFPVFQCGNCGLLITGNLPAPSDISRYYQSDDYISHSDTSKGLIHKIYHKVRSVMLGRKLSIIRQASGKSTGKLLDIGAGTGYFLNHALSEGWEVTGTEKSRQARDYAWQQWKLLLHPEDHLFTLPAGMFDVITLWHVMEHLPDLDKYWKAIRHLLRQDGTLAIALPNPLSTDAQHYREYWAAWDVPRHIWHFSPENIQSLAAGYGFKMVSMHRMPFDSFYVSLLSERYKRSKAVLINGMLHGKISWLSSIANKKKCSSIIYIFKAA